MIGHKGEQAVTVRALRGAAPYMHMYKGKVFVVKTGGGAFRDAATMRAFMEQIAILHHLGIRVVLVHGGGPRSSACRRAWCRAGASPTPRRSTPPAWC